MRDQHYNVFLNYRRIPGRDFARTLQQAFKARGLSVFFDYDSLQDGKFNEEIYSAIENCDVFVISYSEGSLNRCRNDGDWVRIEIEHAIKHEKKIVPVAQTELMSHLTFPADLPHSLHALRNIQTTEIHSGEYFDLSIDNCIRKRFPKGLVCESSNRTEHDREEAERLFREGRKHEDGVYERCDINKVFEFYKAAAEKGHPDAQFEVGTAYNEGWGGRVRDMEFAINWWKKAVEGGSPDAMYALADLYKSGDGFEKDIAQAERLFKQAFSLWKIRADAGDSRAQRRLAYCYKNGVGTKIDRRLALIWFTKAAENNDVWALIELGFYQDDDAKERESWRKKAWGTLSTLARKGNPWCQYELSGFYCGQYGDEIKDPAEAMKWLGKAADQGVSGALWELGVRCLKGEDHPVDFDKAYKLLSRAVQNGHQCALYEYGQCLLMGFANNDEEDTYAKAIASFEKCASRYDPEEQSGIVGGEESYELLERFRERTKRSGEAVALALARVECWAELFRAHEENNHPDVAEDDRCTAIRALYNSSLSFQGKDAADASQILCEYVCGLGREQAEEAVTVCNVAIRVAADQKEAIEMKGTALFFLALAYWYLKKISLALKTCQESLAISDGMAADESQAGLRVKCSVLLGILQMEQGQYVAAINPLRDALSLFSNVGRMEYKFWPESASIEFTPESVQFRLAKCCFKVGNKARAYQDVSAALKKLSSHGHDKRYESLIAKCNNLQKLARPFNYQDVSALDGFGCVLVKTGWYNDYKFCDLVAFDDDDMNLPLLLLPKDRNYHPVQFKNGGMSQVTATEECVDDDLVYPELLVQLAGKSLDALFPKREEYKRRCRCLIVCSTPTVDDIRRIWCEWLDGWRENDIAFCSYDELRAELGKCFNIEASNAKSSEDARYEVWIEGMSYDSWQMKTRIIGESLKAMKSKWKSLKSTFSFGRRIDMFAPDACGVLEKNLTREEAFAIRKTLVRNGFLASARPVDGD